MTHATCAPWDDWSPSPEDYADARAEMPKDADEDWIEERAVRIGMRRQEREQFAQHEGY